MNTQFETRLKSFAWRTGMMLIAFFVAFLIENLSLLNLDPMLVTITGLVLGEISKFVNNELSNEPENI